MRTTYRSHRRRSRAWRPALAATLGAGMLLTGLQVMTAQGAEDSGALELEITGEGADRAHDGDAATYATGSSKQGWVTADLGATRRLDRAEVRLPGAAQTVRLEGSTNGEDFSELSDLKSRKGKATFPLDGAPVRYLRVNGAEKVGELSAYAADTGDAAPPEAPGGTELRGRTLSWDRAEGAVGYDVYADGELRASLPAKTRTWKDTTAAGADAAKVDYAVRARDKAGNQSADSDAVTRTVRAGDAGSGEAAFTPKKSGARLAAKSADTKAAERGATMPYTTVEAEAGDPGGGAEVVGPNRKIGDLAGEASGRKAVTLNETGQYVEFTTPVETNTLVTRFSIPDGTDATLNVYVDGEKTKALDLTSKYAWLYGAEASPGNDPGAGDPRHIYDEAHVALGKTVPAGAKIRLQKDGDNAAKYAIDFVDFEQAAAKDNPDPAKYVEPAGTTHQDVQNALDKARMEAGVEGVYLPPGDYETSSKFQVFGKPVKVIGAGPWFTRFHAPSGQTNTDIGFRADQAANGSVFSGFAYFGNYNSRIDGPGKVFDFQNTSGITIENIWAEHMLCLYWGANTDKMTLKDNRIRNTFADGLNMTNGSSDNLVSNNETRATGDDSYALFSATDSGGGDQTGNVYENLTSKLTWRAAGLAVYGGNTNTFRNIKIADTLVYSGITISSLDFGYPMNGFGPGETNFSDISVDRAGGHFWGAQTFPGIWMFSASKPFRAIRVDNVDIKDPTYSGIMFQTKYTGSQPENPVEDTVLSNVTISGAKKSGDEFDEKSGFGIWANPMPEAGQGPAVGEATFKGLTLSDNAVDIENKTETFKIIQE
ncbi:glycosyl hydrolase [Streptomyces sp. A7024]|uniref:Glycosyl hydrolase n=1 Tax=Streptomyces coryli TaxID=1128680 RepID=A0A6G4TX77_9ACTN|nr:discoidin domain-containing protein [Streptomyces coryli]NGN63647.1 glycosyl hydrolase [Streptomyces coryli]